MYNFYKIWAVDLMNNEVLIAAFKGEGDAYKYATNLAKCRGICFSSFSIERRGKTLFRIKKEV